jgi:hypothetical protein
MGMVIIRENNLKNLKRSEKILITMIGLSCSIFIIHNFFHEAKTFKKPSYELVKSVHKEKYKVIIPLSTIEFD